MEFKMMYDGYKVSKSGLIVGKRGWPLSPSDNGRGYPVVNVYIGGKRVCKGVHRIVAEAWIPNPDNLSDVNHKDCDRWNCNVDNLEWCTHGENIAYSYETENRCAAGENNARCKTDIATVKQICERLRDGSKAIELKRDGFDYNLVRAIKARRNWTHVSCEYNF